MEFTPRFYKLDIHIRSTNFVESFSLITILLEGGAYDLNFTNATKKGVVKSEDISCVRHINET